MGDGRHYSLDWHQISIWLFADRVKFYFWLPLLECSDYLRGGTFHDSYCFNGLQYVTNPLSSTEYAFAFFNADFDDCRGSLSGVAASYAYFFPYRRSGYPNIISPVTSIDLILYSRYQFFSMDGEQYPHQRSKSTNGTLVPNFYYFDCKGVTKTTIRHFVWGLGFCLLCG